ncbi:MAG: hypothetical protein BWY02_00307 [bacterium ADurb.Bin157]|jgi:hypothetical protein|nr:hypothetical protein [Candidatus Riflebacteria bacterium]OQB50690.1 MAG: hypothetical protein BWY02_00307 [bacterium ADurb.Bin157]
MDKRRWIIVFSVFLCMTFALSLLKSFYRPAENIKKVVVNEVKKQNYSSKIKNDDKKRDLLPARIKDYGEIQYPEPAPHTFAVENSVAIERNEAEMKYRGKILK